MLQERSSTKYVLVVPRSNGMHRKLCREFCAILWSMHKTSGGNGSCNCSFSCTSNSHDGRAFSCRRTLALLGVRRREQLHRLRESTLELILRSSANMMPFSRWLLHQDLHNSDLQTTGRAAKGLTNSHEAEIPPSHFEQLHRQENFSSAHCFSAQCTTEGVLDSELTTIAASRLIGLCAFCESHCASN